MNKELLERIDSLLVNLINEGRNLHNLRADVYRELNKDFTRVLADNKVGARLNENYFKDKEFTRQTLLENSVDEYIIWSLNGFDIYQSINWGEDSDKYPFEYSFATILRGSGEMKSSYPIKTETQLNNLYYSIRGLQL